LWIAGTFDGALAASAASVASSGGGTKPLAGAPRGDLGGARTLER
jgi:hypothetical protein